MDPKLKNQYHYRLEIPVKFIPKYIEPNEFQHNFYEKALLNEEFLAWLNGLKLDILGVEQFVLDPEKRRKHYVHIDDPLVDNHVKLNFVYCDKDYNMNWYSLKEGSKTTVAVSKLGTTYEWADKDDCNVLYSAVVGQPSIINANVLHDVDPVDHLRYCFSITLTHLDNPTKKISWEEAEEIFKDYVIGA
jgi:hypothetical protein